MNAVLVPTEMEQWMLDMRKLSRNAPAGGSWALYEQYKADFVDQFQDCSADQYDMAMRMCARAAGV